MTWHDDRLYLVQMLEFARQAQRLAASATRDELAGNEMLQLALERVVQLMGEASKRVSSERRELLPGIPWANIAGMRNRLVHDYLNIDLDVLWEIITSDLPRLIPQLERAIS